MIQGSRIEKSVDEDREDWVRHYVAFARITSGRNYGVSILFCDVGPSSDWDLFGGVRLGSRTHGCTFMGSRLDSGRPP